MNIIDKAYYFAMAAHAAVGQKRKYTGEDYFNHPIEVVTILGQIKELSEGVDVDEMIAAALLHDVVEDTQVTLELIEVEFGEGVADLVAGLTDVSNSEDGNRVKRKEIDRNHTAVQSSVCKTIKLADLISNSKSICEHDKEFAKVYIKEKELLLEVLTEGDPTLYAQAMGIVLKAKIELGI